MAHEHGKQGNEAFVTEAPYRAVQGRDRRIRQCRRGTVAECRIIEALAPSEASATVAHQAARAAPG